MLSEPDNPASYLCRYERLLKGVAVFLLSGKRRIAHCQPALIIGNPHGLLIENQDKERVLAERKPGSSLPQLMVIGCKKASICVSLLWSNWLDLHF
jgi:hypothetical protein